MKNTLQKYFRQICQFTTREIRKTYGLIHHYLFSKDIDVPPPSPITTLEDTAKIFQTQTHTSTHLLNEIRPASKMGIKIVLFAVFVFLIWGGLAPLKSYSPASGNIVLSGKKKTIQHLEGGIIKEFLVKEGDSVLENQPLILLEDTQSKARVAQYTTSMLVNLAMNARLVAERDGRDHIHYPEALLASTDPEVIKAVANQKQQFEVRREAITGQVDVLKQRILQLEDSISGLTSQLDATEKQMAINSDEQKSNEELFKKGLSTKNVLSALRQRHEGYVGTKGDLLSKISSVRQQIGEAKIQILNVETGFSEKVNEALERNQVTLSEASEQLKISKDILTRSVIRAPTSGVVAHLQYHTVGGVIPGGQPILDIIPQDDGLVVEGALLPKDIEGVHVGMEAMVNLSAFKSRLVPKVHGVVTYLSADVQTDQKPQFQPGTAYYIVRVEVPAKELERLVYKVKLYPGMPADIFVVTGSRTFLYYLFSPILESFNKAFIEK